MLFEYTYRVIPPNVSLDQKFALFSAKRMLPEYIFDIAQLENNPLTFPEVKTLNDGVTVGGHKITDVEQILNIIDAWHLVLEAVKTNTFNITKDMFCMVNARIVGTNTCSSCKDAELDKTFDRELPIVLGRNNKVEQAIHLFIWAALNQFYWDGNKRTARLMANGILLKAGYGVLNIGVKDILEFNTLMTDFCKTRQADDMIGFLARKCINYIEK